MPTLQGPIQILVEMDVTSYREYPDEDFVQVWEYIGDYEVSVCLPRGDERVQSLKRRGRTVRAPEGDPGVADGRG